MIAIPWPADIIDLEARLCGEWALRGNLHLIRELKGGKSGAYVFACDLTGPEFNPPFSGEAILKIARHSSDWSDAGEAERHAEAWISTPEFALKHLPRLITSIRLDDWDITLTSLVGGGLQNSQPWVLAPFSAQYPGLQRIGEDVLSKWNYDYTIDSSVRSIQDLLKGWLGYRLDKLDGNIASFLEEACKISPNAEAIVLGGAILPNPYAFALRDAKNLPFCPARGRLHGDFHGENILLPSFDRSQPYSLIDLALYQAKSFLFYDHAYLEIAQLIRQRGASPLTRWHALLLQLTNLSSEPGATNNLSTTSSEDEGILRLLAALRQTVYDWINKYEKDRSGSLKAQFMAARVAAGLNFVNKSALAPNERLAALFYSATTLQELLLFDNIPWDASDLQASSHIGLADLPTPNWRKLWELCDQFDTSRNAFVLICGRQIGQLPAPTLRPIGRAPWTIVADLDPRGETSGLLGASGAGIQARRGLHLALPGESLSVNFDQATVWLKSCGLASRPDTIRTELHKWRHDSLVRSRELFREAHRKIAPKPVKVLAIGSPGEEDFIVRLWEAIDESFEGDAQLIIINDPNDLLFIQAGPQVTKVDCSLADFGSGLIYMDSNLSDEDGIVLPAREEKQREGADDLRRVTISLSRSGDLQNVEEDLEIVHSRLAVSRREEGDTALFLRGAEISWRELDASVDVSRDITESYKTKILEGLQAHRNIRFSLNHRPGAGGTTVARRLAWELRGLFPTVIVRQVSTNTAGRIKQINHLTGLPVFAILETAHIPQGLQDQLYRELRTNSTRCVILSVSRRVDGDGDGLSDVMGGSEPRRFLDRYLPVARPGREAQLRALASDDQLKRYRSPFFFGLFAFEEQFTHITQFVSSLLGNLAPRGRALLINLALITRYSQFWLSPVELLALADGVANSVLHVEELIGISAGRLVIVSQIGIRVAHPTLAEEILKQLLPSGRKNWQSDLAKCSIDLIVRLAENFGETSERAIELLTQMYIVREPWSGSTQRRRNFSELILAIPSKEGQHRLLAELTERFPSEAHFWNHLGRHHSQVMKSPKAKAEECLAEAIRLDSNSDIHYHALGMIHRFAMTDELMKSRRAEGMGAGTALENMAPYLAAAEQNFAKARSIDEESEYSYITAIQTLLEAIENIFRISGTSTYHLFLSTPGGTADWARDKIFEASRLLRAVKTLRANENPSVLLDECSARLAAAFGDFESALKGLRALLIRSDANVPNVRRLIATAQFTKVGDRLQRLDAESLREVADLMKENLDEDPTRTDDLRLWLRCARRLPDFDMIHALDLLNGWAFREDSPDGSYYLYILHFLRWYEGLESEAKLVSREMARCRTLIGSTERGKRSYEWLANAPHWCPIAHQSELGIWVRTDNTNFYADTRPLKRARGVIVRIRDGQAGEINIYPDDTMNGAVGVETIATSLPVFFAPRGDFLKGRDENKEVSFYLGFSFEGLRAWQVEPAAVMDGAA